MAISRNLVGRESVAWVQIPPSPPEKPQPNLAFGRGFFHSGVEGALRNHVAAKRRRGKVAQPPSSASRRLGATNRRNAPSTFSAKHWRSTFCVAPFAFLTLEIAAKM